MRPLNLDTYLRWLTSADVSTRYRAILSLERLRPTELGQAVRETIAFYRQQQINSAELHHLINQLDSPKSQQACAQILVALRTPFMQLLETEFALNREDDRPAQMLMRAMTVAQSDPILRKSAQTLYQRLRSEWESQYHALLATCRDRPLDFPGSEMGNLHKFGDECALPMLAVLVEYSNQNFERDDNGSGGLPYYLRGPFLGARAAYDAILLRFFRDRLQQITYGAVKIPPLLEFNTVYFLSDEDDLNCIEFVLKSLPESYMDYFKPYEEQRAHTRYSQHGRITHAGEKIALPNYRGNWELSAKYGDDPERLAQERAAIAQHNKAVKALLREKGFSGTEY